MQLLFAILVFVMITLAFGGIFALLGQKKESVIIRTRLEAIEKGPSVARNELSLELIRDELLSSIPTLNKMLAHWTWPGRLRNFIGQAGLQVRPGAVVMVSAVTGLATLEVLNTLYGNFLLALAAGVPASSLPLLFIAFKRARRMAAFQRQFPDVIDLLSRSVRAGHAFTSGLEIAASDLPEPAATEFRVTFDEQRFGLPLRDALLNLCQRVPLMDVRLFVIALLVQKETGGNLVEILDKLAQVIRERFRIRGEVRVRTAQGRLTAILLIALPIVMMLALHVVDPAYGRVLFVDHVGRLMLTIAVIMQMVGAFILWRIVQIKV